MAVLATWAIGLLAYLNVSSTGAQVFLWFSNISTISGFIAWIAWLFVHLLYLIGFRNKLMVFTDWVWNYFTFDRRVRLIIRPVVRKQRTTTTTG
ncbi:MAG: hypothetical protein EOP53_17845 [Sphingobacteriales bacterium]|nr:MAG: hypothetical protein EOP53_17845 [Sphingobacteriales bacterium]